jgi:hypothetical protein
MPKQIDAVEDMNISYSTVETCPSDQLPTATITTMAAAGGNDPLAPHMRPFVRR